MNGNSECDASPQKQSDLLTEVHSAIEEYMFIFESEVNAVVGADGEGVKEQCRCNISCNSFLYTQ